MVSTRRRRRRPPRPHLPVLLLLLRLCVALLLSHCVRAAAEDEPPPATVRAPLIVRRDQQQQQHQPHELVPGAVLQGYELTERAALLGVCDHDAGDVRHKSIAQPSRGQVAVVRAGGNQVAVVEVAVAGDAATGIVPVGEASPRRSGGAGPAAADEDAEDDDAALLVPEGPSLEYQCLLDDIDLIFVNRNYRLRKKFAAGSHGEVWRATRGGGGRAFILKRLFVERGELMVEMGLREAHFGTLLANEPHVTRFVESFFRGGGDASHSHRQPQRPAAATSAAHPPPPLPASSSSGSSSNSEPHASTQELWLVFFDEGISLRQYLYASRESAHTAVLFEPSPFWHKLRVDAHGEDVLREIMRQLLEGVAALHDRGITHRDIKPSNVLVHLQRQADGDQELAPPIVKLADFGSAVDEHTIRHLYGDRGPTQAEETREYQPPEVLFSEFGAPYDFAHPLAYDLWSVGVVFLEIVLGSPQVFMISPRARAKLDVRLRGRDETSKLKSYLLHVLTHEFCIFQPSPHELQRLWKQHALVSDGCHFGRFNTTIVERDPMQTGLRNRWGLDLMWKLLQWNPSQRISARGALQHAFFKGPYVCSESGRQFATKHELKTHEAYLAIQRAREQQMAFVVREKYYLPTEFVCPYCHRNFSTIASCEQHLTARRHGAAAGTHFCSHDHSPMRRAIQQDTAKFVGFAALRVLKPNVGVALLQGKKKYMEDLVVVHRHERLNLTLYAVIDGHLGTGAAEYVRSHLADTLVDKIHAMAIQQQEQSPLPEEAELMERVLVRELFLALHNGFLDSQQTDDARDFSGCTLTLVVHFEREGRLLSANVGDSRAIFVSGQKQIYPLSQDHWPDVDEERLRIESSGGFISFEGLWRVVGQLAVSRSIGDRHLRKYVTVEPSIFSVDLVATGGGVVVLASDGVWDTMENRDVARFLEDHSRDDHSLSEIAVDLVQESFLRGSLDNLAAVLVHIDADDATRS